MRTNQPEALRLADELEIGDFDFLTQLEAVAELRRLHALNAELLAAGRRAAAALESVSYSDPSIKGAMKQMLAVIAKATGGQA